MGLRRILGGLGKILSSGGVRSAGWAYDQGLKGLGAVNWLMQRFPSLTRNEAGNLATLGRQYRQAGAAVAGTVGGAPLAVDAHPFVPGAGDLMRPGSRFQYETHVTKPMTADELELHRQIFVDSPVPLSADEIAKTVTTQADKPDQLTPTDQRIRDWVLGQIALEIEVTGALRSF